VLFTRGGPEPLGAILDEFSTEPAVYLHVRPEILPVLATRYRIVELRRMWRMVLSPSVCPSTSARDVAIGATLCRRRRRRGEPGFLLSMLDEGVFYGLWENEQLVALAATASVTSWVVGELLRMRIRTVVLNVNNRMRRNSRLRTAGLI